MAMTSAMTSSSAFAGRRSSLYTPISSPSTSARSSPQGLSARQQARSAVTIMAYRGTNCQDGYRQGGPWGSFMMGPNAMMAGAALADLARKFQNSNGGFGGPNVDMAQQIPLFVDLQEDQQQYTLTADVPGLEKSDLKITVNQKERSLKISGERKRFAAASEQSEEDKRRFRRQFERCMGKFQRVFSMIPDTADLSSVTARVDKGVLSIHIKKVAKAESDDAMDISIE